MGLEQEKIERNDRKELEEHRLREQLIDFEYENTADDEVYGVFYKHLHGQIGTMPISAVKKKLKGYGL
jgi:hypothetical protein